MWPRLKAEDFRVIFHYLGFLVVSIGVAMLVPFAMAVIQGDDAIAVNYAIGIGASLAAGFALAMCKVGTPDLKRKQAVAVTALAWIVCSLFGAIPLYLSGHYASYLDSVFESMSSFTTTGLSVCIDIEHMSQADVMWRYIMNFIGGQGIVVVMLSINAFARSGSRASLYYAEGRHDHMMPEIKNTVRFIGAFSVSMVVIFSVVLAAILVLCKGFSVETALFHGIGLAMAGFSTTGFTVNSMGIAYYHCWPLEIALILTMLFGSITLVLFIRAFKGRIRDFFRNYELRLYVVWMCIVVVGFVAMLAAGGYFTDIDSLLRKGVFTAISAATSGGFNIMTTGQTTSLVSLGALMFLFCAMAIGGMHDSTAGGIKVMRIGVLAKDLVSQIKQVLLPDTAKMVSSYENMGRKTLDQSAVRTAATMLFLSLVSYAVGTVVGVACGYDGTSALFETISANSNNGLSTGITSSAMPAALKVTYIIQMCLGRLEFLSVLATFAALLASLKPVGKKSV